MMDDKLEIIEHETLAEAYLKEKEDERENDN